MNSDRRRKPRLFDLYCGVGGATRGYQRAGFYVIGVDHKPQPNYCGDEFIQEDVLWFLEEFLTRLQAGQENDVVGIHASPPCQPHSSLTGWGASRRVRIMGEDLIGETRERLELTDLPWVMENVQGSTLKDTVRICGQSLGLKVRRHRLFEANFPIMVPPCYHPEPPVIVVRGAIGRKVFDPRRKAIAPSLEQAKEVMEMPWAETAGEVCDAIPPRYTELIGGYLMAHLGATVTA